MVLHEAGTGPKALLLIYSIEYFSAKKHAFREGFRGLQLQGHRRRPKQRFSA
jgi:hypothetical protein